MFGENVGARKKNYFFLNLSSGSGWMRSISAALLNFGFLRKYTRQFVLISYMILVYFKWITHYLSFMFFCWYLFFLPIGA